MWKVAIKFAKNREAMKKRVALQINNVVADYYPVLQRHYLEFYSVENALQDHFDRFLLLESAMALAIELDPIVLIAENGISLCDQFVGSIALSAESSKIDAYARTLEKDSKGASKSETEAAAAVALADKLKVTLAATKAKYEDVLAQNDQAYAVGLATKRRLARFSVASKAGSSKAGGWGFFGKLALILAVFAGLLLCASLLAFIIDGISGRASFLLFLGLCSSLPLIRFLHMRRHTRNKRNRSWMEALPSCFGQADLVLAVHRAEEERFVSLVETALSAGFSLSEIHAAVEAHLKGRGCQPDHIRNQLERFHALTQEAKK